MIGLVLMIFCLCGLFQFYYQYLFTSCRHYLFPQRESLYQLTRLQSTDPQQIRHLLSRSVSAPSQDLEENERFRYPPGNGQGHGGAKYAPLEMDGDLEEPEKQVLVNEGDGHAVSSWSRYASVRAEEE